MLVGALILPSALFTPLQFSTHSATWFVILEHPAGGAHRVARSRWSARCCRPCARTGCAAWAPRWRRCTSSSSAASCGGVLAGFFTNAIGVRGTVIVLGVPDEHHRRPAAHERRALHPQRPLARRRGAARGAGRAPQAPIGEARDARCCRSRTSTSPTARCRCCSTSTSRSHQGECVALLGTNGAGKSTILRVISGLEVPERGVVRLNGRNITYVAPEQRAQAPRHRAAARRQGRVPEPHRRRRTSR